MKIVNKDVGVVSYVVRNFVDLLAKTYGPAGKSVLIQDGMDIRAVDDGKQVAKHYELHDEFENAVIGYIREATEKTDSRVGDGTTTSAILMGAIVDEVVKENPLLMTNPHGALLELQNGVKEAVEQITKLAKPVKDKKELYRVALNSYNNDEVAKLIADTLFEVGPDGVISVEDSPTTKTEVEVVPGMELDKGYLTPYLINQGNDKVVLKNARVFLLNKRLDSLKELVPVLKEMIGAGQKEFLIVAEGFGEEVVAACIMNKIQGHARPLLVENPAYGDKKLELLKDLACVTGATIVDPKVNKLENFTLDQLGLAGTVTAKKDSTVIANGGGKISDIGSRVEELKTELEKVSSEYDKSRLSKRVASLLGGVAVLRVGANTENEQKTKKLKAEDSVNATKIAFKDGIVPGAGRTFEKIKTTSEVLNKALQAPRKRLEENGKEFLDDKVFDPAGVLIAALESAVSIACGLIKVGGIIATKREEEKNLHY